VYSGRDLIASYGDWQEAPDDIEGIFAQTGAFPLEENSRDAAVYLEAAPGAYTMHLAGSEGGDGLALAEIFVIDPDATGSGLVNLSARAEVGTGSQVLVPGFVIAGSQTRRVLIRGIGPGLEQYDVPGFLPDPEIEVFSGMDPIDDNQDWEDSDPAALIQAFQEVGAPALVSGSKDAAILLDLAPGSYTAHIRSADGALGVALLEVFFLE